MGQEVFHILFAGLLWSNGIESGNHEAPGCLPCFSTLRSPSRPACSRREKTLSADDGLDHDGSRWARQYEHPVLMRCPG
ncbi:hypothetical protein M407DRAFT_243193 [Tulasnella calospora MUT 4182]|uniref:Secreted protein n=1 Tax=Tulasnella calospora MUT 4182 TaxID=1051891 RepID=A0A0C3QM83_9AGAM|nr:hypothetical protein M407DRAFT_243193 [Tulasnella calospora MUT 4182]